LFSARFFLCGFLGLGAAKKFVETLLPLRPLVVFCWAEFWRLARSHGMKWLLGDEEYGMDDTNFLFSFSSPLSGFLFFLFAL